jgi:hypothetical protein
MRPRSRLLLDKSLGAMLAAIEIYNKPVFSYREESFAILAVNAWELLLKARLLQLASNKLSALLIYEPRTKIDGTSSDKLYRKKNRAGNFSTIGIFKAIDILANKYGEPLGPALKANIESIVEIRDNAVHFVNKDFTFAKTIHEIGTAAVKNYVLSTRQWFGVDIGAQGMFLMPLAFLSNTRKVDGVGITHEEQQLMSFLSEQKKAPGVSNDRAFDVALTIEVSMKRSKTSEGAKFSISADPDAVAMRVEEKDIRDTHPWSYENLSTRLSLRFTDFKANAKYHQLRKVLESNPKFCKERLLDPGNPSGVKKKFYNPNIAKEFDPFYERAKTNTIEDPKSLPISLPA